MYWQHRYLDQDKAFSGTSGLDTIDLPNAGLLGCVQLQVYATAGSTAGDRDVGPLDALTKIELVVNGSQVVKSLTGREIKAMMAYQKMAMGQDIIANYYSHANRVELFINLGRHYHDLEYLLDLSKVNDPELRITYDFTATSHDGFTNGEAQTGPYRDVICHLLRESDIIPKGYIQTQEISRFMYANAKKENLVVPRGPTYSNLYVESYYKSCGLSLSLDTIEVNINNGERIPLRLAMQEFIDILEATYGRFRMSEIKDISFDDLWPSLLEVGEVIPTTYEGHEPISMVAGALWGQQLGIGAEDPDGTAYTTAKIIRIDYDGLLPFSLAAIPLYDPWDPRTWIDTSLLGDFWVRYECTASGGSTNCPIKLLGDAVIHQ